MRYIISENKLEKIQLKFLDHLFGDLEEVHSERYFTRVFWKNNNGVVLELTPNNVLMVHYDIWDEFSNMFGIDGLDVSHIIRIWAQNKLGLGDEVAVAKGGSFIRNRWGSI